MVSDNPTSPAVDQLVAHLFRHQAGQIAAVLTRRLGPHRIDLVEDIVQETLIRALRQWPHRGVPDNPAAWLMRTANNLLVDILRRQKTIDAKGQDIICDLKTIQSSGDAEDAAFANELQDDLLLMMFAACHPSLSVDASITFTLKVLCGFSTAEIARAFLTEETTIAQRIVRVKQHFRQGKAEFEIPSPSEFGERLETVLQVLYFMFNEGYVRHSGDDLIRSDLCQEAIRLLTLVAEHPKTSCASADALLALMCFQASRLPARADDNGDILLLEDQDRSRWDRRLMADGFRYLDRSARGNLLTRYHLEAGIASFHAAAPSFAATDWPSMRILYETLAASDSSPVVRLNLAVVVSMVDGPEAGLAELQALGDHAAFRNFHLFFATRADFCRRLGQWQAAADDYSRALTLAGNEAERRFLAKRLAECRLR